ncbi:MAG: AAA family ATPase [Bdellovibrionota bacterium]
MLRSVNISKFRCFSNFKIENMGRINIIMGKNNAGKTCLLEALDLLKSGTPASLVSAANRRAEFSYVDTNGQPRLIPEIKHAFVGRALDLNNEFEINGKGDGADYSVKATIVPAQSVNHLTGVTQVQNSIGAPQNIVDVEAKALRWQNSKEGAPGVLIPLFKGGIVQIPAQSSIYNEPVRFVGTNTASIYDATQLWSSVARNRQHEETALKALRIVESDVERLVITSFPISALSVFLKDVDDAIPLGSFGDGTSRLLALACHLVEAERGLLLVDEIDRGLHVSTMEKMWKLVITHAKQSNTQVFATTHSDDCLRGLASCLKESPELRPEVVAYRVERNQEMPVRYDAGEIIMSAESGIEIR